MAVIILTDNSFLLNHLFDSQVLFPFEKSARMQGFGPVSWRLPACISGHRVRKEVPDFKVIGDAQENESISGIKPVHAPMPHRTGFPRSCVCIGVVVAFTHKSIPQTIAETGELTRPTIRSYSKIKITRYGQFFTPVFRGVR